MSSVDQQLADQSNTIPSDQRDIKAENAKIAEVVDEGRKIFSDFIGRKRKDKQFAQLDPQSHYEYYMKLHPDFARSSPVILRYITLGMFSEQAIFCYLKRCFEHPIKTDEDYCSRQADFVKWTYHFNTKIRGADLEKIWQDTKRLLMEELEDIAKEREKIKAERASRSTTSDDVRREAFKAAINKAIVEAKAKVAAERMTSKIAELEISKEQEDDWSGKKSRSQRPTPGPVQESEPTSESANEVD